MIPPLAPTPQSIRPFDKFGHESIKELLHEDIEKNVFKLLQADMFTMQRRIFRYTWQSVMKPKLIELARKIDSNLANNELSKIDLYDLTQNSYLVK